VARVRIVETLGGVAGAAFALVPVASGCAAHPQQPATTGSDQAQANTVGTAHQGSIVLHDWSFIHSGDDEFVRTGDSITGLVDFLNVVDLLPGGRDTYQNKPDTVKLTMKATFYGPDGHEASSTTSAVTWGMESGSMTGRADAFTVPGGAPFMDLDYTVEATDASFPPFSLAGRLQTKNRFAVFGAYLPNKLALFDNDGSGAPRTRVVEGGDLVRGTNPTLSYTDWRADRVVNRSQLDTTYGQRYSGNRFGPSIVDAQGDVEYEISIAYSTDGGQSFHGLSLVRNVMPPVLQSQDDLRRAAYEGQLPLPADARDVQLAFHVQAFLVVPNYYPGEVMNPKYGPGARVPLADQWDNNGGSNYRFELENHP
jgi:hypothetical protein